MKTRLLQVSATFNSTVSSHSKLGKKWNLERHSVVAAVKYYVKQPTQLTINYRSVNI